MKENNAENSSGKRFYLKWPWNVVIYLLLVIVLRIFAIPVILLIMAWNKKQQPDGPEEGYCLHRVRGRLIQLVWAAFFLLIGAAAGVYFVSCLEEDRGAWGYPEYITLVISGAVAVGGLLAAIYEAYTGLRDALHPEKSALAQSIRAQLPYPEEAPPVEELFAMVDQDIRQNGRWFGKLAVGEKWVLGDEVSYLPRIRGVFARDEIRTHHSNGRIRSTRVLELWIVDDRQNQQFTALKSPKDLQGAFEYLQQRVPAAIFGVYDSKERQALLHANEEEWYENERDYRQKTAQMQEKIQQEQERQSQNQVLTLPDGSVTSRITGDSLCQLLHQCRQKGETRSFQMVPGIPFQGQGCRFSRLVCFPGGTNEPVRLFLEEFSGSPREPGQIGWTETVSLGQAEEILRGWIGGKVPFLDGWTRMERTGRGWQTALERR